MDRLIHTTHMCSLLAVLFWTGSVLAWDIELRGEVGSKASVVRLGYLARVGGLPPEKARALEQLVLAPGPSRAYSRSLSASEIRRILRGRGIDLSECRFTGAARSVVVYKDPTSAGFADTTSNGRNAGKVNHHQNQVVPASYRARGGMKIVEGVEEQVEKALDTRLRKLAGDSWPWDVKVKIPRQALRHVPRNWDGLTLEGVEESHEGRHQLVACFSSHAGVVRMPVEADVSRMVKAVVPVRGLEAGRLIHADDVELRHIAHDEYDDGMAQCLDDVLGKQTRLPLRAGEPVRLRSLEKPILVKRREMIKAVAQRGGIRVTRDVLAIDAGGLGDTITVETLKEDGRKTRFTARVIGVRMVEVSVSTASARTLGTR